MQYGLSQHVRGAHAAQAFAALGVPCAVVGRNRSWTSFVLLDDRTVDAAAVAVALAAPVVQIWRDDDHGRSLQIQGPDGWAAELPIEHDGGGKLGPPDRALLDELVRRRIITPVRRAALARALMRKGAARARWLEDGGVERALGVAEPATLPVPCSSRQLAELVAHVEPVTPNRRASVASKARATSVPKATPVPEAAPAATVDRGVLALHVHYWSELFQANNWILYKLYKKHLPAERRREVDRLGDLVMMGGEPEDFERAISAILGAIWTAADWAAAIRDPAILADEPLSAEQLADWQARLARA